MSWALIATAEYDQACWMQFNVDHLAGEADYAFCSEAFDVRAEFIGYVFS